MLQVFGQFGTVVDVEMFDEERCAYVQFDDFFGAYAAQQYLSGFYIPQHNVMLTVKWLPNKEHDN